MAYQDPGNDSRSPVLTVITTLEGCAYGLRSPTLCLNLDIPSCTFDRWQEIDRGFLDPFAVESVGADVPFPIALGLRSIELAVSVLCSAGLPVFEKGRLLGIRDGDKGNVILSMAMPCDAGHHRESLATLAWSVESLWTLVRTKDVDSRASACLAQLTPLMTALETIRPSGTNQLRFLQAANDQGIPCSQVVRQFWQLGWGVNQARFNSSVFQTTSGIAVTVARDKLACTSVLRRAGLPVPRNHLATSSDDALRLARDIGYPVVIKPSNLDGGVGVSAGLDNEEQLLNAWHKATQHSQSIMVEKHAHGQDYRLIVLDGHLLWAVGREPAGVIGDGASTVARLVNEANQDPRRGYHAKASLRPIELDDEAKSLLQEQHCTLDTIAAPGQFIRLRRSANLSSGGTPQVVTHLVHPDNKALVERAVNVLGLDLGGVDLVIPDIAVSWKKSSAAIIEINAQPQLIAASQTHLYKQILTSRVAGQGRIPTVLVVGNDASRLTRTWSERLIASGTKGLANGSRDQVFMDNSDPGFVFATSYEAGRALLMHSDVRAIMLTIEDDTLIRTGLPFDRFDLLIVLADEASGAGIPEWLAQALPMVMPNCTKDICTNSQALRRQLLQLPMRGEAKIHEVCDESALYRLVTQTISS